MPETVLTQGVLLTQANVRTISGGNANVEGKPTQMPLAVLAVETQRLHTVWLKVGKVWPLIVFTKHL